jgi:hypothetical protein
LRKLVVSYAALNLGIFQIEDHGKAWQSGPLIFHPKARTVFWLTLTPVIEPRRR